MSVFTCATPCHALIAPAAYRLAFTTRVTALQWPFRLDGPFYHDAFFCPVATLPSVRHLRSPIL